MVENVVVGIIVGVVLLLVGRSFHRTLNGKSNDCGNGECRMAGSCVPLPKDTSVQRDGMTQS